ncbi:RloB family protein [Candidatus Marithrix sp. Canyon 246]|uniref:RloB family protein n=1 Tax=Candidatus Marithrix sp. Canyon 246 TaxID=1827136 RepID=UPI00084A0807|nr:RloB family protein [Candidatus Marithrix sp. Canyon 246]
MARKTRKPRKSKIVYYFIVEGCTEENYIKLLKKIYRKPGKIKNCDGGSAKNVLEEAKKIIQSNDDDCSGYVIWFDGDTYLPNDKNLKNKLSTPNDTSVYITQPCVESWLLAHFQKINLKSDKKCKEYEKALDHVDRIPNYKKADCRLLERYITKEQIETAIQNYPDIGNIPKQFL